MTTNITEIKMSDEWQAYLKDTRRICKYGVTCYQKNADHLMKFKHPPQGKGKLANEKRKNARFSPYSKKVKDDEKEKHVDTRHENKERKEDIPQVPEATSSTVNDEVLLSESTDLSYNETFTKIIINKNTQFVDKDSDPNIFEELFLVRMPSDFFKLYECLKTEEGGVQKLLSSVNLELIGPYDLLLGKLPLIDNKDLYLIHWRFFYDPPEFQAVLKKKGKSEYHIGYFRDSPSEEPVFLAVNDSKKDYSIKPIANNIFGAIHWYLKQEKKTSPFTSIACQKFIDKINIWSKEHDYTLEEFDMRRRQSQIVCKSFHGAGIIVPYNKKTQLGYRALVESNTKIKNLFIQLEKASTPSEKDNILSIIQPVITYANIAVDECDFGTGLEAGIALFCSGQKELQPSAVSSLSAVYSLLNREAFSKIIQVHMKHRRKGPDMSIISD